MSAAPAGPTGAPGRRAAFRGLVDFHTHLHLYPDPAAEADAIAASGARCVAASVDVPSYLATLAAAAGRPAVVPTFGVHPARALSYAGRESELEPYLAASPLIGEIGLDHLWARDVPREAQRRVFERLAGRAAELGRYCVVHTKAAEAEVLETLRAVRASRVVIHWYSGPMGILGRMIDEGYYFTFGCSLRRWPMSRAAARRVPAERLLVETDNPVGEPWLGGSRTDIGLAERAVRDLARARGAAPEELRSQIRRNSMRIFRESGLA
ncbi:MAG: TatD family hydrolase [Spirochaetaceae bacterium]|nr:TatD family hydrolase [Spirochaetaceae bacterium]